MRLIAIAVFAVALGLPCLASAQANRSGGMAGESAPPGDRQPTTRDAPQNQVNLQSANPSVVMTREDRALDRALKGICRGC